MNPLCNISDPYSLSLAMSNNLIVSSSPPVTKSSFCLCFPDVTHLTEPM